MNLKIIFKIKRYKPSDSRIINEKTQKEEKNKVFKNVAICVNIQTKTLRVSMLVISVLGDIFTILNPFIDAAWMILINT